MKRMYGMLVLGSVLSLLFCACGSQQSGPIGEKTGTNSESDSTYILCKEENLSDNANVTKIEYRYDENQNVIAHDLFYADGTVKSDYTTYRYDDDNNLLEYSYGTHREEYTYDGDKQHQSIFEEGNLVKEKTLDVDGSLLEEILYDNGEIYIHYVYDEDENILYKQDYEDTVKYEYDDAGKLVKETHYENDQLTETVEHIYDANGRRTKTNYYNPKGEKRGYWENYHYNEKDELVKLEYYSYYGEKLTYNEYTYDEDHNMLSNLFYYEGEPVHFHYYTYDDQGEQISYKFISFGNVETHWETISEEKGEFRSVECVVYDENEKVASRYVSLYDLNDNCVESKKYNADGELVSSKQSKYDQKGRLTWCKRNDTEEGVSYEDQYVFDENDNLIEKIHTSAMSEDSYHYKYYYEKIQIDEENAQRIADQQKKILE